MFINIYIFTHIVISNNIFLPDKEQAVKVCF